ncbi:MAG TPA: zinc ribbon domain-containing protein [Candidatus Anoxymicrobiaceae bacterium]|jgi:uncharacterized protein
MGETGEMDPRFKPIKERDGFALMPDRWKVDFWASQGELSRFYFELKGNARLMGTKCPQCGSVYFWPRSWCKDCYVDCDWVEMPLTGKLTVFSRVDISLSELRREVPFYQGGVLVDGARYPVIAILQPSGPDELRAGMAVRAKFLPAEERTGRPRDFYFVPDE